MEQELEVMDLESMGFTFMGIRVPELRKIIEFYKMRTGDMDLERVDFFTKNL